MANEETKRYTQTMYSLERPDWLLKSGLSKGIFHDRKSTSLIVPAGKSIRFRQSLPETGMGVTLNLMNDDSAKENHHTVTTQWKEVFAEHASAIFLTTPYTDTAGQQVNVEVEFVNGGGSLPTCQAGLDADEFFKEWDRLAAPYALYVCGYAMILIPAKDKEVLRRLHEESGLHSLTAYYDGVFEYFNYLAGLSFAPSVPTDKNIPNRYFMKADKSGGGSAYYGGGWTAESTDSVAKFWLDIRATNWGSLHEISHGYEGRFISDAVVRMSEIWNNILCAMYQQKELGEDFYKIGWLYGAGEEQLYINAKAAFDKGLVDVGPNGHLILFFYLLLVKSMGEAGLIEFYQRFRRNSNSDGYVVADYAGMDLLSEVGVDIGNVDFSPVMSYVGVVLSPEKVKFNSFSSASAVYPLYLLVENHDIQQIQTQLGLRSPLDLVSCADLSVTGLIGSVSFVFDEDILDKIQGKTLLLRDGWGPAKLAQINGARVVVSNLELGVYALQLPAIGDDAYQWDCHYVAVKDKHIQYNCTYVKKYASSLVGQAVYLGGLNGDFCRIAVDVSLGRLKIDVLHRRPHGYFPGQVYGKIVVANARGDIVFCREMLGDNTELFSGTVLISPGFTIEIMHKEPSRIKMPKATASAIIDLNAQINRLKVTEQGLINISLGTDAGENLMAEIDRCAKEFERNPHFVLGNEILLKQDMRRAINTYDEPVRGLLFEKYRAVEFVRPGFDVAISGMDFVWHLRGNGDREIGWIRINLFSRWVEVTFLANSSAHEYFSSVYLSVVLTSATGELVYVRDLRGNTPVAASSVQLPLSSDMVVSVMHREPTRCRISNSNSGAEIPVGRVQHAQINTTSFSLNLGSYWPRETVDS
ncbi:putative mucin/carbohydrate-binding domain-containing protein [Pseudomonas azerbaijanorientalis]|uniref:putative mucin/carbohydrate-binding domain-containing protein n=1 Tax=Pseudomonas azerbaijanorientalis TaxID=2842350 RepID=UPI001CED0B15|nr:putative mucin/carbohydrate-binding domain-containing protein [Pseudomonas azerbaijanorientalis]